MKVEKAIHTDAKALTELSIRSKSHWNYSKDQIESWIEDLTITALHINQNQVYKLVREDQLIGYFSYSRKRQSAVKLENFWIEPEYIGRGFGKIMMSSFLRQVKNVGIERIEVDSDPNAEKFYSKFGFKVIGQLESSIKNRYLPIMELKINLSSVN